WHPICRWRPRDDSAAVNRHVIRGYVKNRSPLSRAAEGKVTLSRWIDWCRDLEGAFWHINDLSGRTGVECLVDDRCGVLFAGRGSSKISHNVFVNRPARWNSSRDANVTLPRSRTIVRNDLGRRRIRGTKERKSRDR